ncbi:hypothetical protein HP398_24220 [Brevibacillus sp. HB1.4B]|uniref:Uncharacterized protein n=2 Tax=Brevibacillus TaxID=55080 RepID=A0ABX5FKI0_9BACL|nr:MULTISPECIES: hypothetical protein [Brevibacillus]ATF15723.1 hypothetical protein A616_28365 [Brevibacillus brevis X23]NRS19539.1 hypothetical protein [Brevibacillus sp. HB1.4B]MDC0763995.1 hypothetical protein [Brevibacillus sp. AG]MED1801380.1 hypothetical protein [Brevibacillus porteri]MED2132768.1 hypothetical protein [Brevibacillus porteri]
MSTGMIQFLVGLGIVGMQNLLGRLNHAYWGAIFPGFFLAYLVYGYVTGLFKEGSELTLILVAIGGIAILSLAWSEGRRAMKAKRKKEMERMELLDL